MKTALTKTILSTALFSVAGFGQAKASTAIACTDNKNGMEFSLHLQENTNAGKAWIVFSDGQNIKGTFKAGIIGKNTRLAGATALYIHSDVMSISVFGNFEGNLNGHAEMKNSNGQITDQLFIACKTQQ